MTTSTVDDFLDGYHLPVEEVAICGRPDLIAEHAKAEAEILGHRANGSLGGPPAELVDRLADLEAEIEASVMVVKLKALPHGPWADLLAAHPPTSSQKADGFGVNPDTFEVAALHACAVEPTFTEDQAHRMRRTVPRSEWAALTAAIRGLHEVVSSVPKSLLLSALRPASAASSDTPPDEGSLAEPSSGDSGEQ